jgi:hypothetical protein
MIHGFESRKEANQYLKKNRSLLDVINKNEGGDESTIKVHSRKGIIDILADCFFGNEGTANYDPQWVNKTDDLAELLK